MKSFMILIYFIMMVIMIHASEKDKNKSKEKWEVKEKTEIEIDEESSHNFITSVLTNVYTKAEDNLKCMVCYEYSTVSLRFSCNHEVCASCADKIMCISNQKCPKCRALLPQDLYQWLTMIHISPILIQITPDIPTGIEKLQHAFPLICSVANLTTVTKCISLGVDVNTKGFNTYFPIHLASQMSVVKYLVEKGADINQLTGNKYRETPLLMSSQNGHFPVVQYLIEHGADVNLARSHGVTPLFGSSINGHLPIVQYLIEHGAQVNQGKHNGTTPLLVSSQQGHFSVVQYLIEQGADVNLARYDDGTTPLLISCQYGHFPVVQYLIEQGADVNLARYDDVTPLCIAIVYNETEVAKFLLRNNANIKSTRVLFMKYGKLELFEILEELRKEIKE